jgi:hypothetical protein
MVRSTEGKGDRVGTSLIERGDPITLTLAAARLDLSLEAGEVA